MAPVRVVAFGIAGALPANSLLDDGALVASYPVSLRPAAFAAVTAQCPIVVRVYLYLDVRRRPEMGTTWVHAAAMPVLNVFGLAAYLAERKPDRQE